MSDTFRFLAVATADAFRFTAAVDVFRFTPYGRGEVVKT